MKHSVLAFLLCLMIVGMAGCTSPTPQPPSLEQVIYQSGEFGLACDLRLPGGTPPYPAIVIVDGSGPADRTAGGNYLRVFERMQQAGYAVFSCDKPGSGESTGTIDDFRLIQQRAQIALDAVEVLKEHSGIDPDRIGLAGISQGGYVMSRALSQSDDIAFMVCISCPGNPGVDQSTYQSMTYAVCEGVPEKKTEELQSLLAELDKSRSYQTYAEYVHYREVIGDLLSLAVKAPHGYGFEIIPEEGWLANNPEREGWWNPVPAVQQATIPILAIYGDKDPLIDPIQGEFAYRQALEKAGNPDSKVVMVAGANHGMAQVESNCMKEQTQAIQNENFTIAPEFLDTLEQWLSDLGDRSN